MLQMAAADTSTADYKHIFPQMQQNDASNLLIIMSKNDPSKLNGQSLQEHNSVFAMWLESKEPPLLHS
jgi:hypothetical protein